jgi:hypothetical protein
VAALWRKLFREKVNETERDDFRRKFERKLKEKKRKEKARFFGGGGRVYPVIAVPTYRLHTRYF